MYGEKGVVTPPPIKTNPLLMEKKLHTYMKLKELRLSYLVVTVFGKT